MNQLEKKIIFALRRLAGKPSNTSFKTVEGKTTYNYRYEAKPKNSVLNANDGNQFLSNAIESNKPLMVCRIGTVELSALLNYIQIKKNNELSRFKQYKHTFRTGEHNKWTKSSKSWMHVNAGFFPPTEALLTQFSKLYLDIILDIDLLALHSIDVNVHGETWLYNNYCTNKTALTHIDTLSPFNYENSWIKKLENKKILVIHPFEKSIQQNYHNRKFIFPNNLLPNFELKTIKAVQSIAGNSVGFTNWFGALDFMKEEINKHNFDIALIGAGAYGLPLAHFVKTLGKQAIHMGGTLQLLFGIMGKRWENDIKIKPYLNQYWTRPLPEEIVQDSTKVEDGCYW